MFPSRLGALPLLVLAALAAAPLGAQSKPRCRDCDSVRVRVESRVLRPEEVERLQRQVDRIVKTLAAEQTLDAATLREVRAQLQQTLRALESSRLEMEAAHAAMAASREMARAGQWSAAGFDQDDSGWLGLWLSSSAEIQQQKNGPRIWRFHGYPIVDAVDPGSPASRAGIEAGDVIIAMDGHDLTKRALAMDRLLRPGKRLPIRVRRGTALRSFTVTVADRPSRVVVGAPRIAPFPEPAPAPPVGAVAVAPRAPGAPRVAVSARPAAPPPPPVVAFRYGPAGVVGVAGAEVSRLQEELADYFGVESGLLVLSVPPGTPAARAGLRPGDVIVRAGREEVESPQELRDAIGAADGRSLALELVRKRQKVRATLRW